MYVFRAKLYEIVDGDTVDLVIDPGFRRRFIERIRVDGIDTPETHGVKKDSEEYKQGKIAEKFTTDMFEQYDGECVIVSKKSSGKYGSWIGRIYFGIPKDVEDLRDAVADKNYKACRNEELEAQGYGKEY